MKLLFSILTAGALCTAYGQGTFEAIRGYNNSASTFIEGTAGGTFMVTNNITVTALGAFNYLFGVNPGTIEVGLWDSSGNLLASSTISSLNPLVNQTRYQTITPVVLGPNQVYSMGAYSTNGTIFLDIAAPALGGSITNASQVALGNSAIFEGGFFAPVAVTNTQGALYIGANFEFQDRTPEPATGLLLGVGGLLVWACRSWRSRLKS